MTNEEWRQVPGFPDYECSTLGRFRSWLNHGSRRSEPRMLKFGKTQKGYLQRMFKMPDGSFKNKLVSRLVYAAFNGPIPSGFEIAHLDGDKENNRPTNLMACTGKANACHKRLHGTENFGERNHFAKLSESEVLAMRAAREERGTTYRQLAADFGVSRAAVALIIRRETWMHI